MSTDEARKQAAGVIDRIKRGEDPNPKPPEMELTVSGLAERFMRVHASTHCKPETAATYHSVIDGRILPALGAMALDEVGRAEVTALHHRLRETPAMANAAVGILSKMFSLAEAWGLVPAGRNPCRVVRRYRARSCERFLTPAEFRRLGRALRDMEAEGAVWPPAIAAIRLLTLTGCRKSEILSLRWDDVDRTAGEFRLRDAKAGPRMVPLTEPGLRVLEGIERIEGNPWVIPAKKGGGRLPTLTYYWQAVRARAGLDDVRIHDLRHSYASRALALGESLSAIGKLLGQVHVAHVQGRYLGHPEQGVARHRHDRGVAKTGETSRPLCEFRCAVRLLPAHPGHLAVAALQGQAPEPGQHPLRRRSHRRGPAVELRPEAKRRDSHCGAGGGASRLVEISRIRHPPRRRSRGAPNARTPAGPLRTPGACSQTSRPLPGPRPGGLEPVPRPASSSERRFVSSLMASPPSSW